MIYKVETSKSTKSILSTVEKDAKRFDFSLLHTYAFREILEGKGFPIDKEVSVLELCNPSGAQKVLEKMTIFSVYLPCRVSIYEEGGKTIIATVDIQRVLNSVQTDAETKELMLKLYASLKELMQSLI